jgi:uncharacterized protein
MIRVVAPDRLNQILAELRTGYEALYGDRLARLVLFGSQARGDAALDSDIDVMVVLRGAVNASDEIRRTAPFFSAVSLRNDVLVTPVYVSEGRFRDENSPLLLNVRREGVPV